VHIHRRIGLRGAIAATLPEKRASCSRLRQRRILTRCNYATYAHKSNVSDIDAPRRADKVIHKEVTTKRQRRVCTVEIWHRVNTATNASPGTSSAIFAEDFFDAFPRCFHGVPVEAAVWLGVLEMPAIQGQLRDRSWRGRAPPLRR
jgi:hypothetical protein